MAKADRATELIRPGRLRYDHVGFAARIAQLGRQAAADGWDRLDGEWARLDRDVSRHLAFEEACVFPGFARRGREQPMLVARLLDEHEDLRRGLDVIGAMIERGHVDLVAVDRWAVALLAHGELENRGIYPWLELQEQRANASGIARASSHRARRLAETIARK